MEELDLILVDNCCDICSLAVEDIISDCVVVIIPSEYKLLVS